MATFDYLSAASYTLNATTGRYELDAAQPNPLDLGGTLDDGQGTGIGEFAAGELIGDGGAVFTGSLPIAPGIDYVAISRDGGATVVVVSPSNVSNSAFPNSFEASQLNNVAANDPFTTCFAAGTLIATPTGDALVENLTIGTLVMTADGRSVPVKWIGRQSVLSLFAGDRARPVRVAAGALGDRLPHTDLILTADHALILDGLAINAGALVNGSTITLDPAPARATYYHVETEAHDVILANGAPAETYVDYVARRAFDNHAEYLALYGTERTIPEMPLPRVSAARLVPEHIRARLAGRTAA